MQGNRKQPILIYTPPYVRDLPGLKVFAIYPDYWGENIKYKGVHNWGEPPCLGYVREQDEHWAGVAALTAGIVPNNATFKPRAVLIRTKPKPWDKSKRKSKNVVPGNKI